MSQSATLRERLLQYAHTVAVQMGFTALSNGRYKLEERLARWLLMALDRSDDNAVTLTHEFLAVMLGTRRPGITTALNVLEKSGLIESRRGLVKILNRGALEETANGSYGAAEFVSWYDGHPDVPRTWPLQAREVAVIGAGNVALDVSRILTKHAKDLLPTDVPPNVYEILAGNPVTDVHVFARRGPAQR